jgi:hypothetical protein
MPTLEILVGMVGSAKSTYAIRRAREGAIIISHDAISAGCHGEYRYEQGLRLMYRAIEEAIARNAFQSGRDAVVDRTHLTRESRYRWVDWARMNDSLNRGYSGDERNDPPPTRVVAVAFPVEAPEVHARRRYEADPRGRPYADWLNVATHHWQQAQAEPLADDEGFDLIRRETWNG